MRSPLIAIVLCAGCAVASAQCVTAAPTAPAPTPARQVKADPAHPAAGLIGTAGAVTHDTASVIRTAAPRTAQAPDEHPHRTGSAMLLAAVAVMSGIALRRYSARDQ